MAKLKTWLKAARPRTVLLSFSGILMGGFLAASEPLFYPTPCVLAALTAILLQVLYNLSNDYGDFKKGLVDAFCLMLATPFTSNGLLRWKINFGHPTGMMI